MHRAGIINKQRCVSEPGAYNQAREVGTPPIQDGGAVGQSDADANIV